MNINKELLQELADFIMNKVTDEQFDMSEFRSEQLDENGYELISIYELNEIMFELNEEGTNVTSQHACGSVGCAIGWLPSLPSVKASDILKSETWYQLCENVLGIDDHDSCNGVWDYLFGTEWSYHHYTNTREAFYERVQVILNATEEQLDDSAWVREQFTNHYDEME